VRKKHYLFLLLLRVVPVVAQIGLLVLLLSTAGPSKAGLLAFFLAGNSVFRGLAPFGLDLAAIRLSSRSLTESGLLNRTLLRIILIRGVWTSLAASALVMFVGMVSNAPRGALFAIAFCGFFGSMVGVLVAFLRPSKALLYSQAIDVIGTNLAPTLIICLAVQGSFFSFEFLFASFTLLTAGSVFALLGLAIRESAYFPGFETIDNRALTSNGISQVLIALNSRLPTLATGFLFSPILVTYIDIGSKFQLVGGTIAWLFGVLQSPDYARDGTFLGKRSIQGIHKSTIWSIFAIFFSGICALLIREQIADLLNLELTAFETAVMFFVLVAALEAPAISAGYGLTMTNQSGVIIASVLVQLFLGCIGIVLSQGNILIVGGSLCLAAATRLAIVTLSLKRNATIAKETTRSSN
jgi:hypothetical protein